MTRNGAWSLAAVVAVAILGVFPAALWAQPQCATPGAEQELDRNEQVLSAERGGVAALNFTGRYEGVTVSIEGRLCDAQGQKMAGKKIWLVRYSKDLSKPDESPDGRPSVQDLQHADGAPFSVLGRRRAVTDADGGFRFLGVPPGNVAFELDWAQVPDHPFVTWNVTWGPGPVMTAGRDLP